jgi:hypothetical protein
MTNDQLDELSALRNQVFTLLIALIVISGTLTVYLYRQASIAGKDKLQAEQLQDMINKNEGQRQTAVGNFITQLVAYGQKNPDFAKQVLAKYGIAPVAGIPANARVAVPGK